MKFNENLKYLRKKEGLTQEDLAEKLNVSRQSITKWESGQALPDIEKIKEIAYMFSVTVDCLIGDIESKSTNKIKKKIDDIGWFILGLIILILGIIISLHNFLFTLIKNEDITITITIILVIIAFVCFVAALKRYLKSNEEIILNMKDDDEGKKERRRYMIKRGVYSYIAWIVLSLVYNLQWVISDRSFFFKSLADSLITGMILDLIFDYWQYRALEKKVKELNK